MGLMRRYRRVSVLQARVRVLEAQAEHLISLSADAAVKLLRATRRAEEAEALLVAVQAVRGAQRAMDDALLNRPPEFLEDMRRGLGLADWPREEA